MPPLSWKCGKEHLVTLSGSRKELRDLVIETCKKDYAWMPLEYVLIKGHHLSRNICATHKYSNYESYCQAGLFSTRFPFPALLSCSECEQVSISELPQVQNLSMTWHLETLCKKGGGMIKLRLMPLRGVQMMRTYELCQAEASSEASFVQLPSPQQDVLGTKQQECPQHCGISSWTRSKLHCVLNSVHAFSFA